MIVSFFADKPHETLFEDYSKLFASDLKALGYEADIAKLPYKFNRWSTIKQKPGYILSKLEEYNEPIIWMDVDTRIHQRLPELTVDYDIAVPKRINESFPYYHVEVALIYVNNTQAARDFLQCWKSKAESSPLHKGDHWYFIEAWNEYIADGGRGCKLVELPNKFCSDKVGGEGNITTLISSSYPAKLQEYKDARTFNDTGKTTYKIYYQQTASSLGSILWPMIMKSHDIKTVWTAAHVGPKYLTSGSIITAATKGDTVWGSGISSMNDEVVKDVNYISVRGPYTLGKVEDSGSSCTIVGDPALLIPDFIEPTEKNSKVRIMPNYLDFHSFDADDKIISPMVFVLQSLQKCLADLSSSDVIISTSLYGLIIAHAYGIPTVWAELVERDKTKFYDYFASIGYYEEEPIKISKDFDYDNLATMAKKYTINIDLQQLRNSCPFNLIKMKPAFAEDNTTQD